MTQHYLVLISYDIAHPKRLRRVAKALEAVGERVQKSVFECGLTRDGLLALRQRLRRLIEPSEDHILIQPICAHCRQTMHWQGKPPAPENDLFWII